MKTRRYFSDMMLVLLVLVLCSSCFLIDTSADLTRIDQFSPAQVDQRTDINGLFDPRIDGYIDSNSPTGYMAEWEDALTKNIEFLSANTTGFDLDVHMKVVSGRLYLAFTSDEKLDEVTLEIDRDSDGASSIGDLKLTQEDDGTFKTEVYDSTGWISVSDYFDMTGATVVEKAATMIQFGSMAIEEDADELTNVEISYAMSESEEIIQSLSISQADGCFEALQASGTQDGIDFKLAVLIESKYYNTKYLKEYFINPPFLFRNVGIDHIEVTQASQDETNSMPLVRNKESLARVFVTNTGRYTTIVEVKLTAYAFALFRPMKLWTISTTFKAPALSQFNRADLSDSANFRLPASWTSYPILILSAEVSPIYGWDLDSSNNQKSSWFVFTTTHDLNVYYIRVNEGTNSVPNMKTPEEVLEQTSNMTAIYPMASPNYIELGSELIGPWSGTNDDLITELNEVLDHLWWLNPEADQIHGFRVNGGGLSDPSWYYGDSFASWSGYGSSRELTMAHEICHNLGPGSGSEQWGRHVSGPGYGCGASGPDATWQGLYTDGNIHELGWHPGTGCGYQSGIGFLVPTNTPDLMTYCQSGTFPTKWISGYRWERLFTRLRDFVPGEPAAPAFSLASSTGDIRIVRGFLNDDGSAILHPSFAFPDSRVSENLVLANVTPTAYLEVEYGNTSIQQFPLYANFVDIENQTTTQSSFTIRFPDDDSIAAIRIVDLLNSTLDEFVASGFSASGLIFAPASFNRGIAESVAWNITMSNSTTIYHYLQYSSDGINWYPLGQPTLGTSESVVFRGLPGSDTAHLRLLLSDGISYQVISGPTFSLPGLEPTVEINGESNSLTTTVGSYISLSAKGRDPETGVIPGSSLVWEMCNGVTMTEIATGSNLTLLMLEPGVYRIGVTYTDDDALDAMDCVIVTVLEPAYLKTEVWNAFRDSLQQPEVTTTAPDPIILFGGGFAAGIILMVVVLAIKRR